MSKEKYSIQDIADIVETEGLGYAVQHYLNGDKIEDENLSKFWKECANLLCKIDEILEPYKY